MRSLFADTRFLVNLSYCGGGTLQKIPNWDWDVGGDAVTLNDLFISSNDYLTCRLSLDLQHIGQSETHIPFANFVHWKISLLTPAVQKHT